jgi:hypothetical protein
VHILKRLSPGDFLSGYGPADFSVSSAMTLPNSAGEPPDAGVAQP